MNIHQKWLGLTPYILIEFSTEDDSEDVGIRLTQGGGDGDLFTDMSEAIQVLREIADWTEESLAGEAE